MNVIHLTARVYKSQYFGWWMTYFYSFITTLLILELKLGCLVLHSALVQVLHPETNMVPKVIMFTFQPLCAYDYY